MLHIFDITRLKRKYSLLIVLIKIVLLLIACYSAQKSIYV